MGRTRAGNSCKHTDGPRSTARDPSIEGFIVMCCTSGRCASSIAYHENLGASRGKKQSVRPAQASPSSCDYSGSLGETLGDERDFGTYLCCSRRQGGEVEGVKIGGLAPQLEGSLTRGLGRPPCNHDRYPQTRGRPTHHKPRPGFHPHGTADIK
jgi:hypothetical protein